MFELLFILMLIAIFVLTGATMVSFFIAMGAALLLGAIFVMVGAVVKLLPWIIVALIALYIYKYYNKPDQNI
ncbi:MULTISPECIES: envelope stress response protein PspG [Vibrio]|uniref:Envelope stress response protein PspG n=1 Tax=Vibrio algicola TaxID=2662262 RepID=A0A5Q0TF05_9VIBR|nr:MULTISPECIES: envelope stress response protein PspG [Vibrio]MBD1576271.1 envelope stress response protein PspG [Vibrio sp. S11_S32]